MLLFTGGSVVAKLQQVYVPLMDNAQCNNYYNGKITSHMVCAGFAAGGKDSCQVLVDA